MATITNLSFNIVSRYQGDGVRAAQRDLERLRSSFNSALGSVSAFRQNETAANSLSTRIRALSNDFNGLNRQARSMTSGMGTLRAALIGLAPALLPLVEYAGALAGGLIATTVAAGSAAGAYIAVGTAAAKMALQLDAAGKKLTPMQQQYVNAVRTMQKAWQDLVKTTGEKTLQPQIEIVKGLTAGVKGLAPVINALHPVVMKVATAFRGWMEGAGFERFRDGIIKFGVPAFDRLQEAGRNALAALGVAYRTFLPTSESLTKSILKASEAFRKWAEGGGFQRFLDRTRETGPQVRAVLEALWQVVQKIVDVMRVLAPYSMAAAVAIAQFISAIPTPVLAALVAGFVGLRVAMGALVGPVRVLGGLFGSGGVFGALSGILPIVLRLAGVLGALGAAIALAWDKSAFFRDALRALGTELQSLWREHLQPFVAEIRKLVTAMEPLWTVLGVVAGAVLGAFAIALRGIVIVLGTWIDMLTKVVQGVTWFWQNLSQIWNTVWNSIKDVVDKVVDAIGVAWRAMIGGLSTAWQAVSGALSTAWNSVWGALKTAVETVWNALKIAWEAVCTAFSTAWNTISEPLKAAWSAVWNTIKTLVDPVWQFLKTVWDSLVQGFKTVWDSVGPPLQAAWSAFWTVIRTVAETVWGVLKTAWDLFTQGLQIAWTAVSTVIQTAWNTTWTVIRTAAEVVWNALTAAWNAFTQTLQTAWTVASTALQAAWNAFWTVIRTGAEVVWTALTTAWNAFIQGLQTVWSTVSSALQTAWTTFWTLIRTGVEVIWTALKTAWEGLWSAVRTNWDAFSSALQGAWTTFWNLIKTGAETIWNALKTAWDAFLKAVQTVWNTISAALKTAWDAFWNAIKTAAETVWNALKAAWDAFLKAVQTVWNTVSTAVREAWSNFWDAIKTKAEEIWNFLKDKWEDFTAFLKRIWDEFSADTKTAWKNTWEAVQKIAKDVWGTIGGVIEKAINFVIGLINGLIKGFNSITEFLKINVKIGEIDDVKFPGLAQGGIVNFAYGGMTGGPKNFTHGGTIPGYAPGRDTIPAVLSRGEGVLTPEAVRGLGGPGFVNGANREFAGHRGAGRGAPAFGFCEGGMCPPQPPQLFAIGGMTAAALAKAGVSAGLVTQGEYSDGALSAGTHLGGGVVDLSTTDPAVLARLRSAGFAAWIRTPEQGFSPHIHAVLMNHPDLSPQARAQVADFLAGGSGLGAGGGDGGGSIFDFLIDALKGQVGKVLKNVYMGLDALAGIGGGIMDFFGLGNDEDDGGLFGTGIGPDIGPNVADAVGDVVGGAIDIAGDVAGIGGQMMEMLGKVVLSMLDKGSIAEGLSDFTDKLSNFGQAGRFAEILIALGKKLVDDVLTVFLLDEKEKAGPLPTGGGGGDVAKWAGLAGQALLRAGISGSQLGAFLALMQAESGGNPGAINLWDSNAMSGNPTQGLMQLHPGTFAAFRDRNLPNDIFNPLANMVAAANYIKVKYGGRVPGSPYADGTDSATPGLHLVGENGPELVGLSGPTMAMFSGGQSVLPAGATATLLNGGTSPVVPPSNNTGDLVLPEEETQKLLDKGGFEGVAEAAQLMATQVEDAWRDVNAASATQWQTMRDTTMAEAAQHYAVEMPAAAALMNQTSNAAWLDMNLQSAAQWVIMRDTTFTEAEFHLGTQMPLMTTTMQAAWNAAWLDMQTQSTTQWTAIRDNVFLPMEEHMGVTMVEQATAMNEGVSGAFTSMGETITTVLDAGIGKMDEFITKAQEAIQVTSELVAAVAEAQAAMSAMSSMAAAGGGALGGAGGGTAAAGVSGNVESWRAMALEAMAAGGLDTSQIDAFLALMQAESSGDPNAVNNWDSNAAAGTPSMGLMQMIQPTFDAHNVTGGTILDPFSNMAASAAYIVSRYGGVVPGSPYENGVLRATPGWHLVGESGPELVGMNGPMMAWFRGGERVLTNQETAAVMAQQALIPVLNTAIGSIDQFIAMAKQAIERAKALTAAAQAARTSVGGMTGGGVAGGGSGPCTLPNAPIIQGPYNAGGVAASAGTHDGGGVYDFPADAALLQTLLSTGWAAWMRGNGDGMDPHIHAVCMSATDLSPQAAWQVQDFLRGGSGLGIPAMARGGLTRRGLALVGERGPEFLRMRGGDSVMSNGRSRRFMTKLENVRGGQRGEGGITINFTFNGPVHNGEDVHRAVDEAIPRLYSALQARSGSRTGG